jgi:hypothetical protein
MVGSRSLTPITEQEYEAIEAAVMETARGRWFLSEFGRRNRHADTGVLLDAIGRLESAVVGDRGAGGVERIRFDLAEMARAIARTKSEIAAIQAPGQGRGQDSSHLSGASEALDGIVRTTERATSDILGAAEHVQEVAWTLREAGASHASCDELDRRATEIYTACSFQDLTAQRTTRIVNTLRYLETRIVAMMEIWGGEDAAPPAPPEAAGPAPDLSQSDVDQVIDARAIGDAEPRAEAVRATPPLPEPMIEDDLVFLGAADAIDAVAGEGALAAGEPGLFEPEPFEPELFEPEAPVPMPVQAPVARIARGRLPLAEAFGEIDALPVEERLRRFT